jgi:hypothetical protein
MSHTPGPWQAFPPEGDADHWEVLDEFGHTATVYGDEEPAKANSLLIAAAPDLLDACEELLIYLGDWDDMDNDTCAKARAAIAKAKGGQ